MRVIEEADWLTPDTETEWLASKRSLMLDRRSDVFACSPDAKQAADEAGDLVLTHLKAWPRNIWQSRLESAAAEISDDLCMLTRTASGAWCLSAASLCAPTFWSLQDKIGQPLLGLHAPVPGAEDLSSRIDRIFTGMKPGVIMERLNWTVQAGPDRFTPSSQPLKALAVETLPAAALDVLYLRVERQTIRKLPESGAVLFTIRICIDPLSAALEDDETRNAFAAAWRGTDPALAAYKGWPAYDRLVTAALTMLEESKT